MTEQDVNLIWRVADPVTNIRVKLQAHTLDQVLRLVIFYLISWTCYGSEILTETRR
jgi:hypothetical protein